MALSWVPKKLPAVPREVATQGSQGHTNTQSAQQKKPFFLCWASLSVLSFARP